MSHFGAGTEYALHCLLFLADGETTHSPSSRDLAEFQGISASYVAKIFTSLERAGIVLSTVGAKGGFQLSRPASRISVLQVVDAVEGRKPVFQCRNIRVNCALFGERAPAWAGSGLCAIHQVMVDAEEKMRAELDRVSIADLRDRVAEKAPANFSLKVIDWFADRQAHRFRARSPRREHSHRGMSREESKSSQKPIKTE